MHGKMRAHFSRSPSSTYLLHRRNVSCCLPAPGRGAAGSFSFENISLEQGKFIYSEVQRLVWYVCLLRWGGFEINNTIFVYYCHRLSLLLRECSLAPVIFTGIFITLSYNHMTHYCFFIIALLFCIITIF